MKKLRVIQAPGLPQAPPLVKSMIGRGPLLEPPFSSPFQKAVLAPRICPSTAKKWKGPQAHPCPHPPPSLTDVFLKGALCCKTRARRINLVLPWTVEASTWPTLPLWLSQGKGRRTFKAASSRVVSPGVYYQAGVTEGGAPAAHPVSNGTETSTLLPLFSSGSSGALRGLLILAYNGKCVAMLNLEPLFTAQRIEGSRSLCLIYKQCMGETGQQNVVVKIHAELESAH